MRERQQRLSIWTFGGGGSRCYGNLVVTPQNPSSGQLSRAERTVEGFAREKNLYTWRLSGVEHDAADGAGDVHMVSRFEVVRLVGDERRVGETLASISRHWQDERECFCFVSPHDDDVVLGAGLAIQLAIHEGVPVHVLVVTDGSMGYCSLEERESIAQVRKDETYESLASLGVPREQICFLGFPDCQLGAFAGRRRGESEPGSIEGFTGLQNAFTHYLRKIRPTQVFVPTMNDLHPDHKVTNSELQISLFHASGDIWPELGVPLEAPPALHEFAIYCDFPEPPTLRIACDEATFEKKLESIAAFRSQKQITTLVDNVRSAGPQEYIRTINFDFYHPETYHHLFQDPIKRKIVRNR